MAREQAETQGAARRAACSSPSAALLGVAAIVAVVVAVLVLGRRQLGDKRPAAVGLGSSSVKLPVRKDHRPDRGGEGRRLRRQVVPARGPRPHDRRQGHLQDEPADLGQPQPEPVRGRLSTPTARRRRSATSTRSSTAASRSSTRPARRRGRHRHARGDLQGAAEGQGRLPQAAFREQHRDAVRRSPRPRGSTSSAARRWNEKVFDAIRTFREQYIDKGPEFIP